MPKQHYTEEFRLEAVRQVTEKGYPVTQVAERLGVASKTLYLWVRKASGEPKTRAGARLENTQEEVRRLKAELRRVTEERDILKKAAAYFARASK